MNPSALPETRFKRILFCTDFSESADAAFEFALDAAIRRPGSTLFLLHVIHEPDRQAAGTRHDTRGRGWAETR